MKSLPKTYHLPVLSDLDFGVIRSAGPGLGNLLFPISRALIAAHESSEGVFIQPTMRQIKLGPFIRNEPDKRVYSGILKSRKIENWKYRLKTLYIPRFNESDFLSRVQTNEYTVEYKGLKNYFFDLIHHQDLIVSWIKTIAKKHAFDTPSYDIAVHIRWGDFQPYEKGVRSGSMRQPLDWYKAALEYAIKSRNLTNAKIVIFSDLPAKNLKAFVDLYGAEIDNSPNALYAISRMGKSALILSSRSTFSMWGAFVGNCDILWDAAFDYHTYWPDRGASDISFIWQ